jgi:hypothetical protein
MCALVVVLSADALRAQQNAPDNNSIPAEPQSAQTSMPAAAPVIPDAPLVSDSAADTKFSSDSALPDAPGFAGQANTPGTGQSFTLWQRTLLHTMQQGGGERTNHYNASSAQSGDLASSFQPGSAPRLGSGFSSAGVGMNGAHGGGAGMSGSHGAGMIGPRGPAPGSFKLDQRVKGSLGMSMNSQLGSFHAVYQNQLGTKNNALGSASASFNSNAFGNGMFRFSAVTTLGSGSAHSSGAGTQMGGGVGGMGGAGGGDKHPSTALSLKLSF